MRIGGQQSLLAGAQTPGLLQEPNGNPGSNDTRFAAANIRPRVDAWKIVIELPHHPLENLRLLPTGQSRQHFLKIAQARHGIPQFIVADARWLGYRGLPASGGLVKTTTGNAQDAPRSGSVVEPPSLTAQAREEAGGVGSTVPRPAGAHPGGLNKFREALNGDLEPKWTEVWAHINLGKIFDVTGQRDRAVNEYQLALRTKDNTQGAQEEASKYLKAPYERQRRPEQ
jgi:tetratricopeptide (TPR) repeat protein